MKHSFKPNRRKFLTGAGVGVLGAVSRPIPAYSAGPLSASSSSGASHPNRISLIDERWIHHTYALTRKLTQPERVSVDPVLAPAGAAGSIHPLDDGGYAMWYSTVRWVDIKGGRTHQSWIHYATSTDGIVFEKPDLGIHEGNVLIKGNQNGADGKPITGIRGCSGFSVLDSKHQKVPHARARYTAMYRSWVPGRHGGLSLAYSDDGLLWTEYSENPVRVGESDTFNNFFYDERIQKYVAYIRPMIHAGPKSVNRSVARIVSDDMIKWEDERVVLDTDDRDAHPVGSINEAKNPDGTGYPRGRNQQFYGITTAPYGNDLYLGFASLYDVEPGTMALEFVHSYDGVDWRREATRQPFISNSGKDNWDAGIIYYPCVGNPLEVGDNWLFYYHGTNFDHHMRNVSREDLGEYRAMGAVKMGRDRLIGYEASEVPGDLVSKSFTLNGKELFLNTDAEVGQVRVSICNEQGNSLKGFTLSDAVPIKKNGVRIPVSFQEGGSLASLEGRQIRLRIYLEKATVFGWEFA